MEYVVGAFVGGIGLVALSFVSILLADLGSSSSFLFVGPVVSLVAYVVLTVVKRTRHWGIGLLIGFFLTLIVLGGACVALIAALSAAES